MICSQKSLSAVLFCIALVTLGGASTAAQDASAKQQQRPRRATPSNVEVKPAAPVQSNQPTQGSQEVEENDVVRVDTQLVSVPAVVADSAGRPLGNLRAENFVIYEDSAPQRLANFATTEAPFEVAVLLDTSGSAREDVALIKGAAMAFIEALRPGDKVALLAFGTDNDGAGPLAKVEVITELTSDREELRRGLERIGTSNGTPFYDSLIEVADQVFRQPPTEELRGRRALVALTDGVDSTSNSDFAEGREKMVRGGVASYFIQVNTEDFVEDRLLQSCQGYGALRLSQRQLKRYRKIFAPKASAEDYSDFCQMGQFERLSISRSLYKLARREMGDLARASGGKTFEATDLRDARAAFAQVAKDIGTQYSLGYYPTNKARDGKFRQIKVVVKGVNGSPKVRAREGYYAPSS